MIPPLKRLRMPPELILELAGRCCCCVEMGLGSGVGLTSGRGIDCACEDEGCSLDFGSLGVDTWEYLGVCEILLWLVTDIVDVEVVFDVETGVDK